MDTETATAEAPNSTEPNVAPPPLPEPAPEPVPETVRELDAPGGIIVDQWLTPLDWGDDLSMVTKITLLDGGGPGEHFVSLEQAPDARVFLSVDEVQRAITALSVALIAMRGFDPQADEAEAA